MKDSIASESVRTQISDLESLIHKRTQEITDAEYLISKAKSDICLAHDMIAHLKNTYSFDDYDIQKPMSEKKRMILDVITKTTMSKGIMIPEIKELIKEKYNINLSSTTIDQKIDELIKESYIYQLNEGRERSKRYLSRTKTNEASLMQDKEEEQEVE